MTKAIIQARMGSTRLPGKVLFPIGEYSLLEHIVLRLKNSTQLQGIILATTTLEQDDVLAEFALKQGIFLFRGSENNVLERFIEAAQKYDVSTIVRICADSPFIDSKEIDNMIQTFHENKCDLLTVNPNVSRLLDGIEIVHTSALKKIEKTKNLSYQEHVTLGLKESGIYQVLFYDVPQNLRRLDYPLTIDTITDYEKCIQIQNKMVEQYKTSIWDIEQILSLNPSIIQQEI